MEERICTVLDCDRTAKNGRGWCGMHYSRWRRTGDPVEILRKKRSCTVDGCDRSRKGQGFCSLHYDRWRKFGDPLATKLIPVEQRFWSKVERRGPHECWPWREALDRDGYGRFWFNGANLPAARYAHMLLIGPIPDGYTIDHVWARGCTRKDCTNPAHLEAVPPGENTLRGNSFSGLNVKKTHCIRGHEFTPENTYEPPKRPGTRQCRTCRRASGANYRERNSI